MVVEEKTMKNEKGQRSRSWHLTVKLQVQPGPADEIKTAMRARSGQIPREEQDRRCISIGRQANQNCCGLTVKRYCKS